MPHHQVTVLRRGYTVIGVWKPIHAVNLTVMSVGVGRTGKKGEERKEEERRGEEAEAEAVWLGKVSFSQGWGRQGEMHRTGLDACSAIDNRTTTMHCCNCYLPCQLAYMIRDSCFGPHDRLGRCY